jgi:hypothetical protein
MMLLLILSEEKKSLQPHIQEAENLPESYKGLEKAGFHFTDYSER